ncbi:MAG: c-type cytochrome [Sandaracinaceae bacterium]|nr:c-type cytochrome [Sandaracinaceae bacterium]
MLSKSGAKAFFIGGTFLCSAAFVGLTVDTFAKIPGQTHADRITPAVARGKNLWDSSNCMGCHTLFGEGAYYAPELTRVYTRRGPDFIRAMIRDPQAMYPGERNMQNYHFSEDQISDLVAFFEWAGTVDLNGFPATPHLTPIAAPGAVGSVARTDDRPQVFNQLCVACHALGGQGGNVGPALDRVGERFDAAYFERWLRDPQSVRANTRMPRLPLSEGQIHELVAFLSLRRAAAAAGNMPAEPVPAQPAAPSPTEGGAP